MKVSLVKMQEEFQRVLLKWGFSPEKADCCARIFAENSRDGVYSHGVNRFPVFVEMIREGLVDPKAEPETVGRFGQWEQWDGRLAPGMYTASLAIDRSIELAKAQGIGAVAVRNTNHWMRGGTYGWKAAEAGCVAICCSNTIANMPPWGARDPRLGNNPLVIAIPRPPGHMVLDMAVSQYSYGKLQDYDLRGELLPVAGGYDLKGELTRDPAQIRASKRILPIGFWKGSALSLALDALVSLMSGGLSVAGVTSQGKEYGLSQLFICLRTEGLDPKVLEEIIAYARSSGPLSEKERVQYPGEQSLAIRKRNEMEGIPVLETIWKQVKEL
jgi:3-dehydro-L-gulonate 2-dehydrogenase